MLTALLATAGVIAYRWSLRPLAAAPDAPAVAIVVAVKGVTEQTPRFIEALVAQNYPHYRVVFVVESRSDAAFAGLASLARMADGRCDLVVAGEASGCAQKVHNLVAGLAALRPQDRVVVFADADIIPPGDWLEQLVRPIALGRARVSSGYRWQCPADRALASRILALADMSIATAARDSRWNLCWGGSTALERSLLDRLDLPRCWATTASDDLTLTQVLRDAGIPIRAALRVLVPSPVSHNWRSLFAFGRRQYLLLRVYAWRHWLFAAWSLCVPVVGAAVAANAIVAGSSAAAGCLAGTVGLRYVRHAVRRSIARDALAPEFFAAAEPALRCGWWGWPLVHVVHTAAFLASLWGSKFTWAGIRYRLQRGGKVVILRRPG